MGLWSLSWEAPGPQKHEKTHVFSRFLQMQDFGSLKLLVAILGPSSPLLGPIWSQNGPQNGPKSYQKNAQRLVQKMDPKITPKMPVLGPKMAPKLGSKIPRDIDPSHLGHPSGARWPQDGPKMAQDAQDAPKMAPRWPKIAPRAEGKAETGLAVSWLYVLSCSMLLRVPQVCCVLLRAALGRLKCPGSCLRLFRRLSKLSRGALGAI